MVILPATAQESINGLLLDDQAYSQTPLRPFPEERGPYEPDYVSLRNFAPTPGDQGNSASCVAWSLAHALTISKALHFNFAGTSTINPIRHSAAYLYHQLKPYKGCQVPIAFPAALNLLKSRGDCLAEEFSPRESTCDELPNTYHHQSAYRFRIENYVRLSGPSYTPDQKIDMIRLALIKKQPVIIGAKVPSDLRLSPFSQLDWKNAQSPHAMVVVGYDDHTERFEIMNSYGPTWGNGGFFQLDYYLLADRLIYSYAIELGKSFGQPEQSGTARN